MKKNNRSFLEVFISGLIILRWPLLVISIMFFLLIPFIGMLSLTTNNDIFSGFINSGGWVSVSLLIFIISIIGFLLRSTTEKYIESKTK